MYACRFNAPYFLLIILISFSPISQAKGKSIFIGEPNETQCRNCHDNVAKFPMLKNNNRDRHHLLINTTIPEITKSKAPNATGAMNTGAAYNCFSCHILRLNPNTGEQWLIEPFRNCLQCHPIDRVTGKPMRGNNVHHETQTFQQRRCFICHNSGGMRGGGMQR